VARSSLRLASAFESGNGDYRDAEVAGDHGEGDVLGLPSGPKVGVIVDRTDPVATSRKWVGRMCQNLRVSGGMSTGERWTIIGVGVAVVSALIAFLAWWFPRTAGNASEVPSPPTAQLTVTPTGSVTAEPPTSPQPPEYWSPSQAPPTATAEEPAPQPETAAGISDVYVTASTGNGLLQKRGDVFEMQPSVPSSINPPYMTFRWSSQGAGGEMSGECNVDAVITGPGDYPQHRRGGDCSGRVSPDLEIMENGTYTITVTVTPLGGGQATIGTTSFTVVPRGG
jgi:hypothetical protein